MAKFLRGCGEGSIEYKAKRGFLIGMGNITVIRKNWKAL
jgi:hypothetical protein